MGVWPIPRELQVHAALRTVNASQDFGRRKSKGDATAYVDHWKHKAVYNYDGDDDFRWI